MIHSRERLRDPRTDRRPSAYAVIVRGADGWPCIERMRSIRIAILIATSLLLTRPAFADGFFTPFMGYNFGGDTVGCMSLRDCQDKHLNLGFAFGSMGRVAGFEEDVSYAKHFFGSGSDSAVLSVMSNLVLGLPLGVVQPYAVGGIGLVHAHASVNPLQVVTSRNAFGYDLGGGINLFLSRHVGLHGDIRRFQTLQSVTLFVFSGESVTFWRASAGLTFK